VKDLTNPRWIKAKGVLFLALGVAASVTLLLRIQIGRWPQLLMISLWCFCRFYYFAFYVIEHYVDPGFRFSGLWSLRTVFDVEAKALTPCHVPHAKAGPPLPLTGSAGIGAGKMLPPREAAKDGGAPGRGNSGSTPSSVAETAEGGE